MKGEKNRNVLYLMNIDTDCDGDSLLVKVLPRGPVCHTGNVSCFGDDERGSSIQELFLRIEKRKKTLPKGSYTTSLSKAGFDRIVLKVAEESLEVIQAAIKETKRRLIERNQSIFSTTSLCFSQSGVPP